MGSLQHQCFVLLYTTLLGIVSSCTDESVLFSESSYMDTLTTLHNTTSIKCSIDSCVSLSDDGTAELWGMMNPNTELNLTNILSVSCGGSYCILIKYDGTAIVWVEAQILDEFVNVDSGTCSQSGCVMLKNDMTIDTWWSGGVTPPEEEFLSATNVSDVVCNEICCVILRHDMTVSVWVFHPESISVPELAQVLSVECGDYACITLHIGGTATAWGSHSYGGDTSGVDLTNVSSATCGGYACVVLKNDGTVEAWGNTGYGGDTTGIELSDIVSVKCWANTCGAINRDNSLQVWGANSVIPTNINLTNIEVASCGYYACIALKNDRTAVTWSDSGIDTSLQDIELTNIAHVDCSFSSCVIIKYSDQLNCSDGYEWVENSDGCGECMEIQQNEPPESESEPETEPEPEPETEPEPEPETAPEPEPETEPVPEPETAPEPEPEPETAPEPEPETEPEPEPETEPEPEPETEPEPEPETEPVPEPETDVGVCARNLTIDHGSGGQTYYTDVLSVSTSTTYAAILYDNGEAYFETNGNDETMSNVASISCGISACVALKNDDTADAWGNSAKGGDASGVDLTNVDSISCGDTVCWALKKDGTAEAWGDSRYGGDTTDVNLTNVASISCGGLACVALKKDGTAEAWGDSRYGGDTSMVDLTNVDSISCGDRVCWALKNDGTAETWGDSSYGGDTSSVDLTNVASISCGNHACVALKNDGTAEAWGSSAKGGDASGVDLTNVDSISCGNHACVALKNDDTAEAWGDSIYGGDTSGVDLTNVASVSCINLICWAIYNNGQAIVWGERSEQYENVGSISIFFSYASFEHELYILGTCNECNNTVSCDADYVLSGADANSCGGHCECNNMVVCEDGYILTGQDENDCGGVCESLCTVTTCDPGFVVTSSDEYGCGGMCIEQCRLVSCSTSNALCYSECYNQPSQHTCNTLSSFTTSVRGGESNISCSWCDVVTCGSGYELVSTDGDDCGGLCVISDPCSTWNGINATLSGARSRLGETTDDEICSEYLTDCDPNMYVDFANLCVFTPPCPYLMYPTYDLLGNEICESNISCNDTVCMDSEVCVDHYGFFSCITTETDAENCDVYDLCGPNFVDEEIDDFMGTFTLDAIDVRYQISECFLDSSQKWHLSMQVPIYTHDASTPGLYLEQHDNSVGFDNTNMNTACYIDLLGILGDDTTVEEYQLNSAVDIRLIGLYATPLSGDDFSSIESWDNHTISSWLRASLYISIPHLYELCGWPDIEEDMGVGTSELTARYLEGGVDVHVSKTCVFSVVVEEDMSYNDRTGLSISFNCWLSQYDPELDALGVPTIFYTDGMAGMEVALSLTYNHVPSTMTIGPFDEDGSFAEFFVFDDLTLECYDPVVSMIYPDWRETEDYIGDLPEPNYCVDNRCRVLIYIRTSVVSVPNSGLDFSGCILNPDNKEHEAHLSFTVKSQMCNGRGTDLSDCEFSALQQIREDLGEFVALSLTGVASSQVLTYNFAAVTAHTKELTKKQLERASCLQLTAKNENPWVKLTTGLNDPQVCYDIAGESCPGDYCVSEVTDQVCLYVYVKEHDLIDVAYIGSQTQIIYETLIVRPIGLDGSALPSFSYGDVDEQLHPNNTVLEMDLFATHTEGISMMPRAMEALHHDGSTTWDIDKSLSGTDGICWDTQELVRFYASLQGSAFRPFKLVEIEMTVHYVYDSEHASSRRLLSSDDEVIDEQSLVIEMEIAESYLNGLTGNVSYTNITNALPDATDKDELAKLELRFVLLIVGVLIILGGELVRVYVRFSDRQHNPMSW